MNGRMIFASALLATAVAGRCAGATPFTNSVGIRMLPIEPGRFVMGEANATPASLGGPASSPQGDWEDQPAHPVTLTRAYFIAEAPVSSEAFRRFQADYRGTESHTPFVTGISWDQAESFCRWLSAREGRPYRLPTEAEWEYAARAGTRSLFWSGNRPPPAGAANPWGLRGIGCGIAEWCADWLGPYSCLEQTDPTGPSSGFSRVVRNGGVEADPPAFYRRSASRASLPQAAASSAGYAVHFAGFRIVQAEDLPARPSPAARSFPMEGVLPAAFDEGAGPRPDQPYFKVRPLLPIPPEDEAPDAIEAAGFNPAVMGHIHSGGLAVMPNGDLLQVSFSSPTGESEDTPGSTMVVWRLRRGSDQWDMPDLFYDLAGLNDQSALLWNDGGRIWFFGGGRGFGEVPFRITTSRDSGATWTPIEIPAITRRAGFVQAQPITSAFRLDGAIYLGSDGKGGSSMLWSSPDDGRSWCDTGGRTAGRHTAFAVLKDGRILGMGGKSTSIDGYMPRVISSDRGRTWGVAGKTIFAALGSNQRPFILRLSSGRLFFAGDFQQNSGKAPPGITQRGSYAALSDDDGQTWRVKRIALARPHFGRTGDAAFSTLGYCAAAQAPDGVIHLTTSMSHPALHFEMNEAWILSDVAGESSASASGAGAGDRVRREDRYPAGGLRAEWGTRIGSNGDIFLDGTEAWFYPDGSKEYAADFQWGRKVGLETYWRPDGTIEWSWEHRPDGTGTWTRYWENGRLKSRSQWRGLRADGPASSWDPSGAERARFEFRGGEPIQTVR